LRASVADDGDPRGISTGIDDYSFLLNYLIEVMFALFVLFPIVSFIIFTGVLGCGRIPGIGGRPYHKRKWERYQARKATKKQAKASRSTSAAAAAALAESKASF
jgi:hypothetical protein